MNTEFYDKTNAAVIGWNAAVKRCCDRQPTSHPESLTAETICRLTGLLPLYPFDVPEGMVATGAMSVEVRDGAAYKQYATITIEEHEAQRAAREAEEATQAQMDRHNQVLAMCDAYGGMVAALGYSLIVVGHEIPCESAVVTSDLITRSLGGTLTDAQEKAKGDIADIYIILKGAGVTDDDIAAVWSNVRAQA
jgi:hypothetical protein